MQQRDGELRELLIDGLASLTSANTESGIKHCVSEMDKKDSTKRLIYAHVFIRVLKEGVQFSSYDDPPALVKENCLCEVCLGSLCQGHV